MATIRSVRFITVGLILLVQIVQGIPEPEPEPESAPEPNAFSYPWVWYPTTTRPPLPVYPTYRPVRPPGFNVKVILRRLFLPYFAEFKTTTQYSVS